MFRTPPRGAHRAPGRAVIDYRALAAPVGRGVTGVGGVAVIGAAAAAATLPAHATAPAPTPSPAGLGISHGPGTAPAVAPAAASPYASVKLRSGSRGDAVRDLQKRLNNNGASLAVDGSFGPRTLSAVRSFQSSKNLAVDGVVGPNTWRALAGSSSGSSSSQPKLRQGNRGSAVRTLQSQLNEAGAGIAVDGSFGPATRSAVRSFQRAAGIGVDGVVGPITWGALGTGVTIGSGNSGGGSSSGSFNGQGIINAARSQIGTRYVWGGNTTSGFDCSGLVHYAYGQAGHSMSRKTARGYVSAGTIIPRSQAQPGDLVAFTANNYGHMGIYVGNGRIIDASSSQGRVVERSIWNDPHVYVTFR